jgi:hypothetical protein
MQLPPIAEAGDYLLVFDLVIEGSTWFAERGSLTLDVPYRVAPRARAFSGCTRA